MGEKNYTGLIPENADGRAITARETVRCASLEEAIALYQTSRQRLLDVNDWEGMTGVFSAGFQLTDALGNEVDRLVQKGDFFRIDIPGPGSMAGKGYDWAQVEDVKEVRQAGVDSIAILVRPAANPQTPNPHVAHFYAKESSSTFVVTRENQTVTAAIYDRNIQANEETKEPVDKLRNALVGIMAKHGISRLQWQALAKAFIRRNTS